MTRIPSWAVAVVGLVGGFAIAMSTTRFLGGIVLGVLGAAATLMWWQRRGVGAAIALLAGYLAAFAVSHPLSDVLGAWPSVLLVSAAVGLASWWFVDREVAADGRPA